MATTDKAPGNAPDKASPCDRLLDVAAELFYRDGVPVGVEALCEAAGVSKRSMYQLFTSKDEVLATGLDRRSTGYAEQLLPGPKNAGTPRERVLGLFERLEKTSTEPDYQGCPFLAALVELKDPGHPRAWLPSRPSSASRTGSAPRRKRAVRVNRDDGDVPDGRCGSGVAPAQRDA